MSFPAGLRESGSYLLPDFLLPLEVFQNRVHDGDGKEGDLKDRNQEMKEELEDDTNPQLKMCSGQESLCSLD